MTIPGTPWGKIEQDALANGQLVYAMQQGNVARSEGVAYALRWIGLRARGGDYIFANHVADGCFAEMLRDQAAYRNFDGGFLLRIEAALRQYDVSVDTRYYMQTTQAINARLVLARISRGEGIYYFEMRRDGGAHAVVVQRSGDTYRLFDASHGHFMVEGLKRFAIFLERFLLKANYARLFTKGTAVAGVGIARQSAVHADEASMTWAGRLTSMLSPLRRVPVRRALCVDQGMSL